MLSFANSAVQFLGYSAVQFLGYSAKNLITCRILSFLAYYVEQNLAYSATSRRFGGFLSPAMYEKTAY